MTTITAQLRPPMAKKVARIVDRFGYQSHQAFAEDAIALLVRWPAEEGAMKRPVRKGTMVKSGVCRWCRCHEFTPCAEGCSWVDRAQTLCSACEDVDGAWRRLPAAKLPNMRLAFFRGFNAGYWASEAKPAKNPYATGATAKYFELGRRAGEELALAA